MPVRQFMTLCLTHPEHGYYMTRDPLGRGGDFVTAPEISQVFGELIGLWAASVWQLMGQPENVRLVELGPGRGTMMLDALRAAQVVPAFRSAIVVHLVEISPVLQQRQQMAFSGIDVPVMWHQSLEEVPEGPSIVLANEFVDALPVNQAIKQFNGWYERVVEIDADDNLVFGIANEQIPLFEQLVPPDVRDAPLGAIYEWRTDNLALALGQRVTRQGGAALLIDYGHVKSAVGETLQAISGHAYADPLASPGEADMTAHVDFQALAVAAESMGARVHGPIEQATVPEKPRRRKARDRAQGLRAEGEGGRDRRRGQAAAGRRPHRDGQAVQGDRHRRSEARQPARLRGRRVMLQARSLRRPARHPPRLLHPRGRRVGGHLRKPQRRRGLGRRPGQGCGEPRAHGGGAGRRAGPAVEPLSNPFAQRGGGGGALGCGEPAARRRDRDPGAAARASASAPRTADRCCWRTRRRA